MKTALKKEIFEKIKKEAISLIIVLGIFLIIFKLVFFKESFTIILKVVFSIFWLFVLPGYLIMYYWHQKLEFIERLIVGIALSAAFIGIFSYYFGILGINIKFHTILLPIILIIIGFFINFFNRKDI